MTGNRALVMAMALLAVSLASGSALAAGGGGYEGNANFLLGQKTLSSSDWSPVEDQTEFAAMVSFGEKGWPVQIAIDAVGGTKESSPFKSTTTELDFGVRKFWNMRSVRNMHPFLGGGLGLFRAEAEVSSFLFDGSASGTGAGAWVDGGIFWRLGERLNLGFEARVSRGKVSIEDVDVEAGGEHLGFLVGFGW